VVPVLARLASPPSGVRIAAVGKSTAQVLRQRGWSVDVVPDQAEAGSLIAALAPHARSGMRVLYPASSRALPIIAKGLSQLGAQVTQVEAYRTEAAALDVDDCRKWIASNAVGAVTFASPSAVVELQQALGKEALDRLLAHATAVAIGPTTARALTERGYSAVVAESANLAGLAATTLRVLRTRH
jgi:uroporphyrinogen-III synthase